MKLLALTEGPDHVCYRYRVEAFASRLAARGWTLESLPLSPHTMQRTPQLREAADADVVILQRKLLPLWQLRLLRRAAPKLIYDFDDALFHRDSYARKGPSSLMRLAHFWATIYTADAVMAGNRYLVEQAATYIEPGRVHHQPTCISPERYRMAAHQAGREQTAREQATRDQATRESVRLVWIGQHSTLPCLGHAEAHLASAAREVPQLELRVICNKRPKLQGINVTLVPWSTRTEAAELADCDIGLSWLPDDLWSQGKCGLKVLQYMAAGLPVVANPVGMNRTMVEDGVTGFLANTPAAWSAAITRLARDPELRQRMGAAGRRAVEEHYNAHLWGESFVDVVTRVALATPSAQAATSLPEAFPGEMTTDEMSTDEIEFVPCDDEPAGDMDCESGGGIELSGLSRGMPR